MLTDGIHHVAIITADTDRFVDFYHSVFEATVESSNSSNGVRLTFLSIGTNVELNVFEVDDNDQAHRRLPMFERGRLDHLGLRASSVQAFDEIRVRLIAAGASDGFVTDFGPVWSIFFTDPDGLEGEVCVANPDRLDGVRNPPGTPADRYRA
jgi:catechol 2,3-dioxygenase-like lactoylglutathione lyase family enzyme